MIRSKYFSLSKFIILRRDNEKVRSFASFTELV